MPLNPGMSPFIANSDTSKYEILGDDSQILSITLNGNEKLQCEPGALMYMDPAVKAKAVCDSPCKRCCAGEWCITVNYTNTTSENAVIGLTPSAPAKVIPMPLQGKSFNAKNGAWFTSLGDVKISCFPDCNCLTCCCAGIGFIRQTLSGDGTAFLSALGTLMQKDLNDGEVIIVDTNSLVAWSSSAKLGVRPTGGCMVCCLSGEGCCNTTLTGPGTVYIQSLSYAQWKRGLSVVVTKKSRGKGGGPPLASQMDR